MLRKEREILAKDLNWQVLALLIFAAGFGIAYYAVNANLEAVLALVEGTLAQLEELSKDVFSGSLLKGVLFIIFNNLGAMASVIALGPLLGIPPLFSLFSNGLIIGFISGLFLNQGQGVGFLLISLLPHGILELPAFFISGALGLKIGYELVFPRRGMKRWQNLKANIDEVVALVPLLLVLIVTAAVIEVLITPRLIQLFYPEIFIIP